MDLEGIMLSEINQSEKDKYDTISLTSGTIELETQYSNVVGLITGQGT